MLSPSDFNNAVPKFTNGNYASNPLNPQYIAEPTAVEYNRGAEPLQTLPAQWWNWFLNKFTGRFNKVNTYVKNIFDELTQLMTVVNMTPSGTEATPTIAQLKTMFETEYPKYMALLMYPVGSIYWTGKAPDDGGDPNVLFGGTWVQIKGKFVWAKGDSDTLNATGGAKNVTLTTNQIPSHTHKVTADGTVSSHTHSVGAHSHGLNSHTHTMNHGHGVTDPSHSHGMPSRATGSTGSAVIVSSRTQEGSTILYAIGTQSVKTNLTVNDYSGSTGQASGSTADSTAFNSGSTQPTFTGKEVTSVASGGGQSHENMPPYVVKYCWERTA